MVLALNSLEQPLQHTLVEARRLLPGLVVGWVVALALSGLSFCMFLKRGMVIVEVKVMVKVKVIAMVRP